MSIGSVISQSSLSQGNKLLGQTLKMAESPMGLSHTVAAQHILMSWLPKAAFSRSKAEIVELTVLDVLETFLVYYGIPLSAGFAFFPALRKLTSKGKLNEAQKQSWMKEMAEPVQILMDKYKKTNPAKLRKLLATKSAAVLMAMVAGGAVWEYALTFFKNVITLKAFNKESFSSVANLSNDKTVDTDNSKVMVRAKKKIATALSIGAATIVLGTLLGTVGHKVKGIDKPLNKFLEVFDFKFDKNKVGKPVVGLSDNLNRFFIANAFIAYIDSARDGLERFEIVSRLSIVLSYLAFGNNMVDRLAVKHYSKNGQMKELFIQEKDVRKKPKFKKNGEPQMRVKKMHELLDGFKAEIRKQSPDLGEKTVKNLARKKFLKVLPNKLKIFFIPQLIGVSIAGFANAGVNRIWTAYRFNQEEHKKAALSHFVPQDLSLSVHNKSFDAYFNRLNRERKIRMQYA